MLLSYGPSSSFASSKLNLIVCLRQRAGRGGCAFSARHSLILALLFSLPEMVILLSHLVSIELCNWTVEANRKCLSKLKVIKGPCLI